MTWKRWRYVLLFHMHVQVEFWFLLLWKSSSWSHEGLSLHSELQFSSIQVVFFEFWTTYLCNWLTKCRLDIQLALTNVCCTYIIWILQSKLIFSRVTTAKLMVNPHGTATDATYLSQPPATNKKKSFKTGPLNKSLTRIWRCRGIQRMNIWISSCRKANTGSKYFKLELM